MVMWFTGRHRAQPLGAGDSLLVHDDVVALQAYLDGGGNLFLTGQDIAEHLSQTVDALFLPDYLGVNYDGSTIEPIFALGIDGDPVSDGMDLVLMGSGGAANQNSPDNLIPTNGAQASFTYSTAYPPVSGATGGVTWINGNSKTVFWGFGLEAIAAGVVPGYDETRENAMARVLNWLVDLTVDVFEEDEFTDNQTGAVPNNFTLAQNYPNPFNGRTVIEFAIHRGGQRKVSIDVYDILGRRVKTVFSGTAGPGLHRVVWNGDDQNGRAVASGVYLYRVITDDGFVDSRRMVYLK